MTAAKFPPNNITIKWSIVIGRNEFYIPAESPEIATRFASILNCFALFVSRIYFATFIQSSRPAGNGYSGARRYLYINSKDIFIFEYISNLTYPTEITIKPV
jgi:hypothetical protein